MPGQRFARGQVFVLRKPMIRGPVAKYGSRRRPPEPKNAGSNPAGPVLFLHFRQDTNKGLSRLEQNVDGSCRLVTGLQGKVTCAARARHVGVAGRQALQLGPV